MLKITPDFTYESQHQGLICGVDEAGRGPLAGPVVASAVILNPQDLPEGLNDSKALTHLQREDILNIIIQKAIIGIGIAEPEEIDRMNILSASMIAMTRAVNALPDCPDVALIDGNRTPELNCCAETIIKGDAKSLSIAAASIVAKVTRDRLMIEAEMRYPGYGFAQHKGYPTPDHQCRLLELGPSPIHRRSFAPVRMAYL